MTLSLPGLGELAPVDGAPDGVECWTTTSGGAVVAVLVEEPSTVDDLDPGFIVSVLDDRETLVARARAAVADALGAAESVEDPEFTFHAGRDWVIRFTGCANSELGVLVVFEGDSVVEVDDLADAEE
ncbi:hypothetical protein [Umezawaea sp. Da 62-37]|uniref:hypothetical protein n=1 Tax=Umezawaea sp. Da 62-37 TaxID=3075927 RepID=UPI0028F74DF7|nr:hypothetical protein [Umezawaea sp. Da 62-37]WNV86101.1 hypothetical protein RM788_49660 [Umezawaea sp. Da 62-37]